MLLPGGRTLESCRLNVIAANLHQKVKAQQRGMAMPSCSPSFRHTCAACRQELGASRALPPGPPPAHPDSLCDPPRKKPRTWEPWEAAVPAEAPTPGTGDTM